MIKNLFLVDTINDVHNSLQLEKIELQNDELLKKLLLRSIQIFIGLSKFKLKDIRFCTKKCFSSVHVP